MVLEFPLLIFYCWESGKIWGEYGGKLGKNCEKTGKTDFEHALDTPLKEKIFALNIEYSIVRLRKPLVR